MKVKGHQGHLARAVDVNATIRLVYLRGVEKSSDNCLDHC